MSLGEIAGKAAGDSFGRLHDRFRSNVEAGLIEVIAAHRGHESRDHQEVESKTLAHRHWGVFPDLRTASRERAKLSGESDEATEG